MARDRSPEARRLDVGAFAASGEGMDGQLALSDLGRLRENLMPLPGDAVPAPVRWSARGELRPVAGGAPQPWLHLVVDSTVTLQCQRCLQPMDSALAVDRWFRFAADENEAARLDEETDEDVLVTSRGFDLIALVEDELILALPIVPRHEACPEPLLPAPADADADVAETEHPFAALAALRRRPGG
jgi:uncharacterized protein